MAYITSDKVKVITQLMSYIKPNIAKVVSSKYRYGAIHQAKCGTMREDTALFFHFLLPSLAVPRQTLIQSLQITNHRSQVNLVYKSLYGSSSFNISIILTKFQLLQNFLMA